MKEAIYSSLTAQRKETGENPLPCSSTRIKWIRQKSRTIIELAVKARVDYLFVGGSLVISDHLDQVVQQIKITL